MMIVSFQMPWDPKGLADLKRRLSATRWNDAVVSDWSYGMERSERAMGLLAQPDHSVAEVADSTGYASPSHFVASFRQRLGVTPGTYREAVLN
jgi:hypothetical protein